MYLIIDRKVIVALSNGVTLERDNCSDEVLEQVKTASEEQLIDLLLPERKVVVQEREKLQATLHKLQNSCYLTVENNTIYWKRVSPLSVPLDLALDIYKAEGEQDFNKVNSYRNFWTLMSLNTDSTCRENLYWFLQLHGLVISKSGFFLAYRNVDTTKEEGVYTDHHSHTFRIKIGEMVTMPKHLVDSDSNVECSRGLHCASQNWLSKNYFGNVGLACLVNPADVMAVPHRSQYGKLRTCAYLPIATIEFDSEGKVIPLDVETGFDCSYITKVIYEGVMGTELDSPYRIKIPKLPELDKASVEDRLLQIAKECIEERNKFLEKKQ